MRKPRKGLKKGVAKVTRSLQGAYRLFKNTVGEAQACCVPQTKKETQAPQNLYGLIEKLRRLSNSMVSIENGEKLAQTRRTPKLIKYYL